MTEREKVIRGLEAHANPKTCETCAGEECPYYNRGGSYPEVTCSSFLAADALALLKEQEAKVIKEEDLDRFQCKDVWIEKILSDYQHIVYAATLKVVSGYCIFQGAEYDESINDYNVECACGWRCWTSRPTLEQMRETPWEGEKN